MSDDEDEMPLAVALQPSTGACILQRATLTTAAATAANPC